MSSISLSGFLALGLSYAGGSFAEVTGGQYARKPIGLVSQDGISLQNMTGITFGPDVGTDWGLVAWTGLFDAPTAGNLLLAWPQRLPRYTAASGTVTIAAGTIQLLVPRLLSGLVDSVVSNFPAGGVVGTTSTGAASVVCGASIALGSGTLQAAASTGAGLLAVNNLGDLANAALGRVNINQGDSALTFGATIVTDCNTGNVFHVTLSGSAMLAAPTNLRAGASYIWRIIQDAIGGRLLTFDPIFKFPGGVVPAVTPTPNATDILSALSDGVNVHATLMKDMR